jgi:hypothetical protein
MNSPQLSVPSDFFATSYEKVYLDWFTYLLALGIEFEIEYLGNRPRHDKWIKKSSIKPMATYISNQIKHIIMNKHLTTVEALEVDPTWVKRYMSSAPQKIIADLIVRLNSALFEHSLSCKECSIQCLINKDHNCRMFDDVANSKPLSGVGCGNGSRIFYFKTVASPAFIDIFHDLEDIMVSSRKRVIEGRAILQRDDILRQQLKLGKRQE